MSATLLIAIALMWPFDWGKAFLKFWYAGTISVAAHFSHCAFPGCSPYCYWITYLAE